MSLLNEGEDVLEFIDSKKMNFKQVELKSTIIHYSKIITKSMIYSYTRMENIDNCFICTNLISNIFWILLNYSYNIKLTMFLCDRAIILFNEYMEMISSAISKKLITEKKIKVNITDVKMFIYNKTIGPLKINDKKVSKSISKKMNNLKLSCLLMKKILKIVFINYKIYSGNLTITKKNKSDKKQKKKSNLENVLNNTYTKLHLNLLNLYNNNGLLLEMIIDKYCNIVEKIIENNKISDNYDEYSQSKNNEILNYNINYLNNNIYIDTYIIQYINNYYKNSDKIKEIFFNVYSKIHDIKMKNIHKKYKKYDKKKFVKHIIKIVKLYIKDLKSQNIK